MTAMARWEDVLKAWMMPNVLTGMVVFKIFIGRKAKHADLLDHYTKEVALKDALLNLKILATEEKSAEQITVKEDALKQAQELDARYRQESNKLTAVPPERLWWDTAPFLEKLIPLPIYDRNVNLDRAGKCKWWGWICGYSLLMFISGWCMYNFWWLMLELIESFKTHHPGETPQESVRDFVYTFTLLLFGLYVMWCATDFRRGAYATARRSGPTAAPSIP